MTIIDKLKILLDIDPEHFKVSDFTDIYFVSKNCGCVLTKDGGLFGQTHILRLASALQDLMDGIEPLSMTDYLDSDEAEAVIDKYMEWVKR